jgi:hypothetical protein
VTAALLFPLTLRRSNLQPSSPRVSMLRLLWGALFLFAHVHWSLPQARRPSAAATPNAQHRRRPKRLMRHAAAASGERAPCSHCRIVFAGRPKVCEKTRADFATYLPMALTRRGGRGSGSSTICTVPFPRCQARISLRDVAFLTFRQTFTDRTLGLINQAVSFRLTAGGASWRTSTRSAGSETIKALSST